MAANISLKALLEAGVHFGHRTHKWHPKMKPYIFTERNGVHIIDLQQTVSSLNGVCALIRDTVAAGGTVLFVGTKRQAQDTIETEAQRCGMPYVTDRWLGGTLTNWRTMKERIDELTKLEKMEATGELSRLTKKEGLILTRRMERLRLRLGGIRNMTGLPNLVFTIDVHREATAVHESNILKIPLIALVDTNCDPTGVDYVIPSNDDAIRAIKLLTARIADAVLEGRALRKDEEAEESKEPEKSTESKDVPEEDLLGESTLAKVKASTEKDAGVEAVKEK
jgi:small subunit ribosomal protein S2